MHLNRSLVRRVAVVGSALAAIAAVAAPAVPIAHASATATNPVANRPWGIYQGSGDGLWPAYQSSTGRDHRLLGKMALHARVRWYGAWISTGDIAHAISSDITQEQAGNPNTLVWMALFRLWPQQEAAAQKPLTTADQQAYRDWVAQAVQGIGSAHAGVILEPDLPLILSSWGPSVRAGLTRYAAQELATLPNTTTYIDAGAADWLSVAQVVKLLESTGIQYARGFDLGATHHGSTASEIRYCKAVGLALARDGYPNKRCVISTSDNGHPYTNKQFYKKYPRGNANNPPACTTMTQKVCVALGIPPTTDVTNSKWKLPAPVAAAAATWVDAFVWDGHPWKINNDHDFNLQHALDAARTDPYF